MTKTFQPQGRSVAQSLAIQSQIHLPGTVGRILSQIRSIEQIAPLFAEAGLVRAVDRPNPLNLRVAGISTQSSVKKTLGGYLYVSVASRLDVAIDNNAVSTTGQDSTCELDDINFEDQSKRLQLIGIRQAYEIADAALKSGEPYNLILLDCPLTLERSMVPQRSARSGEFGDSFEQTFQTISAFWKAHRHKLIPWNPQGTAVLGLTSKRYGAIVQVAQQDLRTTVGHQQILPTERVDQDRLKQLDDISHSMAGIGERRFVYGIVGSYTRTVAFQMNIQTPRMEPSDVVDLGVLGLHFRAGQNTAPRLMQLIGNAPDWNTALLDRVCGQVMALMVVGGQDAMPLPIQLAAREQKGLSNFLDYYSRSIVEALKQREVEDIWLSGLDEE
ncbi:hypothetical protein [Lyngbya confervoides]|uniref:NurA domain-containing protein n=1 Tax=Lyngbya confervoides BDU141951 TaxID=1574623 RepID=A0ABD4T7J6_9CYAN|nr:hypothetical protein [Lyngbya confervoides]MCM1984752.1 hypothetical protein [Lyngbya confervoides BDU141951]